MKNCIFDWKRTLYDPDTKELIDGVYPVLELLHTRQIPLILIGKGDIDMYDEVDRLKMRGFFSSVVFKEGLKSIDIFAPFVYKKDPKETYFIGDRVRSELMVGNELGATTVWVKQGKFENEIPENASQEPTFIVYSLADLLTFLQKL